MTETAAAPVEAAEIPADKPAKGSPKADSNVESPVADTEAPQTFDADYVKKLRRENQSKSTRMRELEAQLKEIEDAQKSDLQKAQEQATAAQEQLKQAQVEAMRAKVAAAKSLPPSIADRLRGDTVEDMEADADALLADIQKQYVQKAAPSREATGAGVAGKGVDYESMSPADMVKAIRERGR